MQWFIPLSDQPGEYAAVLAYRVDSLWNGTAFPDTLDVSFLSHGFVFDGVQLDGTLLAQKGYTDRSESSSMKCTTAPGKWQCSFSVPTDASKTRMLSVAQTQGEVTLHSVLISPSSMIISITYPTAWEHVTLAHPKDDAGNKIQWHTGTPVQNADGTTTWNFIGAAPPSTAKAVTFAVYDKNTDETKAGFTVALS